MRPTLLDLYCSAGGAAMGYHRAGFDVYGVDIAPQKRYPFAFERGDALEFLARYGREFDVIHASPPCQRYSKSTKIRGAAAVDTHPDLVEPTRKLLRSSGRPWVMENVMGAPLLNPVMLCGAMFGLRVYRHRLFESSELLYAPPHPAHVQACAPIFAGGLRKCGGFRAAWDAGAFVTIAGGSFHAACGRIAMGIEWMTRDELCQAIPPAFTEFLGAQLMWSAEARRAA